ARPPAPDAVAVRQEADQGGLRGGAFGTIPPPLRNDEAPQVCRVEFYPFGDGQVEQERQVRLAAATAAGPRPTGRTGRAPRPRQRELRGRSPPGVVPASCSPSTL